MDANYVKKDRAFAARLKRRYGLTVDAFQALWEGQGGRCPICDKKLRRGRGGAGVDHDHRLVGRRSTEQDRAAAVRGILCSFCNYRVVGAMERAGRDRVFAALRYLEWMRWDP
jgi:hypothetical protein